MCVQTQNVGSVRESISLFENASENNNTIGVTSINDEARRNSQDGVSELSVPRTQFDRQSHIHHVMTGGSEQIHNPHHKMKAPSNETHHMLTGQTAQTNQFTEFLTGSTITPRESPQHQYQNLSTQVSQDNNLPVVEQTPTNQNLEANNSINRLADAILELPPNNDHKQPQCSNQYPQIH